MQSRRENEKTAGEKATIPASRQNSGHAGKWLRGHISRKNVHGYQPTNRFPDKLGKAPLSHKVVYSHGQGGGTPPTGYGAVEGNKKRWEIASGAYKQDQHPRAGRQNAADRIRSGRGKQKALGNSFWSTQAGSTPTGRAAERRRPDAKQTGKTKESAAGESLLSLAADFRFYCARGNSPSVSPSNMRKNLFLQTQQTSHTGVQRMKSSGAGFQGLRKPLRRVRGRRVPCFVSKEYRICRAPTFPGLISSAFSAVRDDCPLCTWLSACSFRNRAAGNGIPAGRDK